MNIILENDLKRMGDAQQNDNYIPGIHKFGKCNKVEGEWGVLKEKYKIP